MRGGVGGLIDRKYIGCGTVRCVAAKGRGGFWNIRSADMALSKRSCSETVGGPFVGFCIPSAKCKNILYIGLAFYLHNSSSEAAGYRMGTNHHA